MKKRYLAIVAVLCILLVVYLTQNMNDVSAATADEMIAQTLQELGVSDVEITEVEEGASGGYTAYSSASKGLIYYFNAASGDLKRIVCADYGQMELTLALDETTMEPAMLRSVALEFAADCIVNRKIGDLTVELETVSGSTTTYEIIEMYDGIPTGTKLGMIYRNDGQLVSCIPHYGSVFVKEADGRVRLIKGDDFVGEAEALNKAYEALRVELGSDVDPSAVTTVKMEATGGELYYSVVFQNADPNNPTRLYDVEIDAYSGDILGIARTL